MRRPGASHKTATKIENRECGDNSAIPFAKSVCQPLELFADLTWETYCPVARLGEHLGQTVVTCGLVVAPRTHHQINGEPMKFLMLADWTGMVETELFAQTYKSYGLATVRYPVLENTATVVCRVESERRRTCRVVTW